MVKLEELRHYTEGSAWKEVTPTGGWKLEIIDDKQCDLYLLIEDYRYQFGLMSFTRVPTFRWVHEDNLRIRKTEVYINDCKRGRKYNPL